jgi:hypothetical protein
MEGGGEGRQSALKEAKLEIMEDTVSQVKENERANKESLK